MTRARSLSSALFLLAALVLAPPADAQMDFSAAPCNNALGQVKDYYNLLTEREQYEQYKSRLCSSAYTTHEGFSEGAAKLGITIPVAEALLGLSGSTQQKQAQFSASYSAFCKSTFSEALYRERYQLQKATVSADLAHAWTRCVELYKDAFLQKFGTFIAVTPVSNLESFSVKVSARGFELGRTLIKTIEPAGSVTCYRSGKPIDLGKTKVNSVDFLLECKKDSSLAVPITIETSAGTSQAVVLPSAKNKLDELDSKLSGLSLSFSPFSSLDPGKLKALTGSIDIANNQVIVKTLKADALDVTMKGSEQAVIGPGKFVHTTTPVGSCPTGYFVTGVQLIYSGTCHNQCEGDGGILAGLRLVCQRF
jgi:hypothetical protein